MMFPTPFGQQLLCAWCQMFKTYHRSEWSCMFCSFWKWTTAWLEEKRVHLLAGLPAWAEHPLVLKPPIDAGFQAQSNAIPASPSGEVLAIGPPTCSRARLRSSELTCVTSHLQERQSCSLPALVFLPTSDHLHISPWLPTPRLRSPPHGPSDAAGRIPLSQRAQTTESRQADGLREAEIALGSSRSVSSSRTVAPLIFISFSLMHWLRPSSPLFLSFSPIKSLFPVCISSHSCSSSLTSSLSLTHCVSLLFFFFFHPTNSSAYVLSLCFLLSLFPMLTLCSISKDNAPWGKQPPVLQDFVGQCICFENELISDYEYVLHVALLPCTQTALHRAVIMKYTSCYPILRSLKYSHSVLFINVKHKS